MTGRDDGWSAPGQDAPDEAPTSPVAGQPVWGAPAWGQPAAAQPGWGQPVAGQPVWGAPAWGAPSGGQPAWGAPGWGQPGWGQPAPPIRNRHGLRGVLAVLAAAVLLLFTARAAGLADPAGAEFAGDGWMPLYVEQGEPVRWDSCSPVRYVLRTENAPPGAEEMVDRAIAAVAAATGLEFVDEGPTDEVPQSERDATDPRYGDGWAPVLIAWSDETESRYLKGDSVGVAGPIADDPDGRGWRLLSGDVLLDGPDLDGDPEETYGVLLHELGHLMGLDHVNDPLDTMHPDAAVTQVFTPGALRGLAVLGDGPCFDDDSEDVGTSTASARR